MKNTFNFAITIALGLNSFKLHKVFLIRKAIKKSQFTEAQVLVLHKQKITEKQS